MTGSPSSKHASIFNNFNLVIMYLVLYDPDMRIPRGALIAGNRGQHFHVISRVVDRRLIFKEKEKSVFLGLMRQFESFSGLRVKAYCVMGNHFHLLIHVPVKPEEISNAEVRERMRHIYSEKKLREYDEMLSERVVNGDKGYEKEFYDRMRCRMYDLSQFVKDIKLRFSKWYNGLNERKGTLWEERFRSIVIEGEGNILLRVAAYIELNPLRARIVNDPKDYRWCSYTESLAGGRMAREGIMSIVSGTGNVLNWDKACEAYRQQLYFRAMSKNSSKPSMDGADADNSSMELDWSRLSDLDLLRVKVRYFSDGLIIGSRHFIEEFYRERKEYFGRRRTKICSKAESAGDEEGGEVYTYRNVGD